MNVTVTAPTAYSAAITSAPISAVATNGSVVSVAASETTVTATVTESNISVAVSNSTVAVSATTPAAVSVSISSGISQADADTRYQPLDADLTSIATTGFTATAFLKKTAANTWTLDTATYEPTDATIVRTGQTNYTDLTDGGTTNLHSHSSDHTRSHALDETSDHSIGSLTSGYLVKSDGSKLASATNTDSDVSSAVSLKHAAMTLDTNADTLLSLTGQQLGLDTKTATHVLAGPVSGDPASPTFRALAATDIPALAYEPTLTKGNLTASSPLAFDQTRQVIGGAATVKLGVSAADKMIYSSAQDVWQEADITAAGRALLDDSDADAQLVTLSGWKFTQNTRANILASTPAAKTIAVSTDADDLALYVWDGTVWRRNAIPLGAPSTGVNIGSENYNDDKGYGEVNLSGKTLNNTVLREYDETIRAVTRGAAQTMIENGVEVAKIYLNAAWRKILNYTATQEADIMLWSAAWGAYDAYNRNVIHGHKMDIGSEASDHFIDGGPLAGMPSITNTRDVVRILFRRGTRTQIETDGAAGTGAYGGEPLYDTTDGHVWIGNGTSQVKFDARAIVSDGDEAVFDNDEVVLD